MTSTTMIFDTQPRDIGMLSAEDLEALVVRLCESESSANLKNGVDVVGGGDLRAADGGIDVSVTAHRGDFRSMFLPAHYVGFQVKRQSMGPRKVEKEMQKNGKLKSDISDLLTNGGAYIIFCSQDNCGRRMLNDRIEKMICATGLDRGIVEGRVLFYDQSKICQWVSHHPLVNLWIREKLNLVSYGWKIYGKWSSRAMDVECEYLTDAGLSVDIVYDKNKLKLDAVGAINECRKIIRSSYKAVRIVGHSGIGKTRFVEALFDKSVGSDPLNQVDVIYKNVVEESNLGLDEVLCYLALDDRKRIVVLDNCSPNLHRYALDCIGANYNIGLISIDFDVGEDSPSETQIVRMSLVQKEIAKNVLQRQYPSLGYANASRIANFSDGNPRLAKFFAERVESGEEIAHISDKVLFEKLFYQRNIRERQVQVGTEILSLVHSFDFSSNGCFCAELKMLARLNRDDEDDLYRTASALNQRGLIRKRGNQQILVPQALALKLARLAFENFRLERIREVVQDKKDSRLLRSFSRRLGMLHDLEQVQALVSIWLKEDGILGGRKVIDKNWIVLLRNVAPVAEQDVLLLLEKKLDKAGLNACAVCFELRHHVKELLFELTYDGSMFDRCVRLLVNLSRVLEVNTFGGDIEQCVEQLYQPYMSGTHASTEVRASIVREYLSSSDSESREIGKKMWMSAMSGKTWTISYTRDFGIKYRDFGSHPDIGQFRNWRVCFLKALMDVCTGDSQEITEFAKGILTKSLIWLWDDESLRDTLVNTAKQIRSRGPWLDGWNAVQVVARHRKRKVIQKKGAITKDDALEVFERTVAPITLTEKIFVTLRGSIEYNNNEAMRGAISLGEEAVNLKDTLREVSNELFCKDNNGLEESFGRGLAKGSSNKYETWNELVTLYKRQLKQHREPGVLVGFLSEVMDNNWEEAQEMLDGCARDERMRRIIIQLHPYTKIGDADVIRCTQVLNCCYTNTNGGHAFLRKAISVGVDEIVLLEFMKALVKHNDGDFELVHGISLLKEGGTDWSSVAMQEAFLVILSAAGNVIQVHIHNDIGTICGHIVDSVTRFVYKYLIDKSYMEHFVDRIMGAAEVLGGDFFVHTYVELIDFIAEVETVLLLEKVFGSADQKMAKERYELLSRYSLAYAQAEHVSKWCVESNRDYVWRIVGEGIEPFEKSGEGDEVEYMFTEYAQKLLDTCNHPAELLIGYTRCVLKAGAISEKRSLINGILKLYNDLAASSNQTIASAALAALEKCSGELTEIDSIFHRKTIEHDGFDF